MSKPGEWPEGLDPSVLISAADVELRIVAYGVYPRWQRPLRRLRDWLHGVGR